MSVEITKITQGREREVIYDFRLTLHSHNVVKHVVRTRRGMPAELIKEVTLALLPILTRYRRSFGTLGQVAGCASMAATEAINIAVYQAYKHYPTPQRSNGKKQSRPLPASSVKGRKVRGT